MSLSCNWGDCLWCFGFYSSLFPLLSLVLYCCCYVILLTEQRIRIREAANSIDQTNNVLHTPEANYTVWNTDMCFFFVLFFSRCLAHQKQKRFNYYSYVNQYEPP